MGTDFSAEIRAMEQELKDREERNKRAEIEYQEEKKKTLAERMGKERVAKFEIMLRDTFTKFIKRDYPQHKDKTADLFKEYFELQMQEKVTNMKEFAERKHLNIDTPKE